MRLEEVIGANVRQGREAHGWTQDELGRRVESHLGRTWTRQAVSNAEKGGRDFAASDLVALALVLDVHIGWLFQSSEAVEVELPGSTLTVSELHRRISEHPGHGNQRDVGQTLERIHDQALSDLEHATKLLATAGEYTKWLLGDVEGDQ